MPIYKQAMLVPENDNPEDANAVRVDIEGETVGHLSRRNATLWRSKMISENRSGVVMRPVEIVWDRSYVAEGSYGVLLDIDLSLPDSKEPGSVVSRLLPRDLRSTSNIPFQNRSIKPNLSPNFLTGASKLATRLRLIPKTLKKPSQKDLGCITK